MEDVGFDFLQFQETYNEGICNREDEVIVTDSVSIQIGDIGILSDSDIVVIDIYLLIDWNSQ